MFCRYIIFYPISTFLTLFCNILRNPLDPHIKVDLKLLVEAPTLLQRQALASHPPLNETIHVKRVEDFMSLLGALAKCAVEKAERESPRPNSVRLLPD
jgi:hypothetical protein